MIQQNNVCGCQCHKALPRSWQHTKLGVHDKACIIQCELTPPCRSNQVPVSLSDKTPCTTENGAYHLGIEVGNEQAGGLVHSMGAPMLWVCQEQNLFPVLQVGNDLEGFGHLASRETAHDLSNSMIDLNHLGVKAGGDQGGACLPTA